MLCINPAASERSHGRNMAGQSYDLLHDAYHLLFPGQWNYSLPKIYRTETEYLGGSLETMASVRIRKDMLQRDRTFLCGYERLRLGKVCSQRHIDRATLGRFFVEFGSEPSYQKKTVHPGCRVSRGRSAYRTFPMQFSVTFLRTSSVYNFT